MVEGGRVFCAFTREWLDGDVAVADGRIAGVGRYDGGERVDASGRFVVPGLIDAHVHVESSKLLPAEFARVVVARGTTAVVCDPHELANVLGADGAHWMLDASAGLPLRVYVMAPSCVPASALESPRGPLGPDDMAGILRRGRALGVAEVMDFPSVIAGDPGGAREGRAAPARRRPRARRARRASWTPTRPPGSAPTTRRRPGRRRSRSAGAGSGSCCARPPTRAT